MNTNRQTFWNNAPAPAACLGGVGRVNGDYLNTGTFSLVFKHLPQPSKPRVMRGQGQVSVTVHKAEGKVLNGNQVILGHNPMADLMQIIRSLISNLFVQASHLPIRFPLAATAFDLSSSVALKAAQFGKSPPQPTGIFKQLARRKGGKAFQAHIHPYLLPCKVLPFGWDRQFKHQTDVPAISDALDHGVLDFSVCRDGSMVTHPHFANILNVERSMALLILAQLTPITIGVLNAIETVTAFETRKPWLFSRAHAAEESGEGLVQTAQQVLQTGSVDLPKRFGAISAYLSKMGPLRSVANPLARFPIGRNPLFEGSIVDQPGLPKQKIQLFSLLSIWAEKVFISTKHSLTRLVHFDESLDGFRGDLVYRANAAASALHARQTGPQSREFQALELDGKSLRRFLQFAPDKQVNGVGHDFQCLNRHLQLLRLLIQQRTQFFRNLADQNLATVYRTSNQRIIQRVNTSRIAPISCVAHRTIVLRNSIFIYDPHEIRKEKAGFLCRLKTAVLAR